MNGYLFGNLQITKSSFLKGEIKRVENVFMFTQDSITQRLTRLGEILVQFQHLWQPRAFHHLTLAWESDYPDLSGFLRGLSYEQAVALQVNDDALLEALSNYLPIATELRELINLPIEAAAEKVSHHPALINEIPGRKLAQIDAFLATVEISGQSIIDWCSGKGHLSRLAANRLLVDKNVKIHGLEFNQHLVVAGNVFARQQHLPVCIHHVDVMSDDVDDYLNNQSQILALHACGDLHLQLLRKAIEHRCSSVSLSPCCFHLIADEVYQPLSQLAQSQLEKNQVPQLSRDMLRTAVQQTVTAPHYVRERRETLQAWRLGFDVLQRELFKSTNYFPLPTLPTTLSKGSFKDFCYYIAELKNIHLPIDVNFIQWEQAGQQRFFDVTKLDLARLAFRRAMEVWLVLDRARFLQEQGYHVSVSRFCEPSLTPRNLLITAVASNKYLKFSNCHPERSEGSMF
jgi:hypothetical protein